LEFRSTMSCTCLYRLCRTRLNRSGCAIVVRWLAENRRRVERWKPTCHLFGWVCVVWDGNSWRVIVENLSGCLNKGNKPEFAQRPKGMHTSE
jgi:hypothetical protein